MSCGSTILRAVKDAEHHQFIAVLVDLVNDDVGGLRLARGFPDRGRAAQSQQIRLLPGDRISP